MTKTYEQSKPEIVTELTPELAAKIWRQIERKRYNDKVSKEAVLHNLKQLKAQMGKRLKISANEDYQMGISTCMDIIDNKIAKINGE